MITKEPDIQGHRGCRGLMPENTIAGCIKAVDLGVTTLEMDVVVSRDSQLIVSHEAFFNHEISTHPSNLEINKENEHNFNVYKMSTSEIKLYDVGLKPHPRFPDQQKIPATKPTLTELIQAVESHITQHHLRPVHYNIEIKHQPDMEHIFHPDAETFTALVYKAIMELDIKNRCIIQSFNPACLNILHAKDASVKTALLVENQDSFAKNLDRLDYIPDIYSPNYKLLDRHLMYYCKEKNIKVIPWTVNDEKDILKVLKFGVDGIISDYPDRVIEIYNRAKLK